MATYTAKIVNVGDKTCVLFPKQLCDDYQIDTGNEIDIALNNKKGMLEIRFLEKELSLSLKKRSTRIRPTK